MSSILPLDNKKWTYMEYARLEDDNEFELLDGKLIKEPSPRTRHQIILKNLTFALENHLRETLQGMVVQDLDVVLDQYNVVTPDLIFISSNNMAIVRDLNIQGIPDLVIEVLSPGTESFDRRQKSRLYHRFGINEYWLVSPEATTIEVFRNEPDGWKLAGVFGENDFLETRLLPGFSLNINRIFV
ncbi:MAG: Uma2 family endonuclease [Syntrophomonas sp.]